MKLHSQSLLFYLAILTLPFVLYALPYQSSYKLSSEDDDFLDRLERASILFFWEQADPQSGQIRDRAVVNGVNEDRPVASISSTGFGLTALIIAHKRGFMDKTAIETRIHNTLDFILNKLEGSHGFYHHFIDMKTGKRVWNSEVSTIDTAILMNGVLTVREYFKDNADLRDMAQAIYDRADYRWFWNETTSIISMGWRPESGLLQGQATWNRYCELLMLLLQAIGAKEPHSVPAENTWTSFRRDIFTYKGISYFTDNAPLFIHQFSHAWYDFRNRRDAYTDYYENSIKATKVHMIWTLDVLKPKFPKSYSENSWGISASDSATGYTAWGGPDLKGEDIMHNIDGSIVPCATAGSLPFMPKETLTVLKYINATYPKVWDRYGFRDAFNPTTDWYNPDVIGIDLGVTVLMAENLRTGFVWNLFTNNEQVKRSLDLVGLKQKNNSANIETSQSLLIILSQFILYVFKLIF